MNENFTTEDAAKLHEWLMRCTVAVVIAIGSVHLGLWLILRELKKQHGQGKKKENKNNS